MISTHNDFNTVLYIQSQSPIGRITILANQVAIKAIHFESSVYFKSIPEGFEHAPENELLKNAVLQLKEYFQSNRSDFTLPFENNGTEFQKVVWSALEKIPYGATASYSEIAKAIEKPLAVRAVATAIARNPLCILVPCHRVIGSGGTLRGYVAGTDKKRYLLELEAKSLT